MLRSGDEIGPYTLINKLGKGAFGVVWLVERGGITSTPQGVIRSGEGVKNALAPELPFGAIIAKIGNGKPFLVGYKKDFNTQEQVYLAINDSDYSDNSGSFTIRIKYK